MKLRFSLYKGRINSLTFLVSFIIAILYAIMLIVLLSALFPESVKANTNAFPGIIFISSAYIWGVVWLLMATSLYIRRAHDHNMSAMVALVIAIIPLGWLYVILKSGTKGRNEFGDKPGKQNHFLVALGIELEKHYT